MILTTDMRHNYKGELSFVWGFIDQNENGDPIVYNLKELLTNVNVQMKLQMRTNNKVYIMDTGNDLILPKVVESSLQENGSIINFQNEKALPMLVDKDERDEVISLISEKCGWAEEHLEDLVLEALDCIRMLDENSFVYKVNSNALDSTKKLVDEYNNESKGSFVDYTRSKQIEPYRTQKEPTEQMGFYLPRVNQSNNPDVMEVVYQNAVNTILSSAFYFRPYGDDIGEVNSGNFTEFDLTREQLFGYEENDYLPLQENEERFYNDLVQFIEMQTTQYCALRNMDPEYTIENCIYSKTPVEAVLTTLIRAMVSINWGHSKFVPQGEFDHRPDGDSGDDDDGDGGSSEFNTDGQEFSAGGLGDRQSDLAMLYFEAITEFMTSNKATLYAWAEVIIKLARWGERKPTKLTLDFPKSKSVDRYELDLTTFKKTTAVNRMVELKLEGKSYQLAGVIRTMLPTFKIDGTEQDFNSLGVEPFSEVKECIIGAVLIQPYKIGEEEKKRAVAMDLPTLIHHAEDIVGLRRNEDGNLEMYDELEIYESDEEFKRRVNQEAIPLGDVRGYIESKDKSQVIYLNNNEMYLAFNKDLTREDINKLNFPTFMTLLTQLPDIKALTRPHTPLMEVFNLQAKMYLNYLSDCGYMYQIEGYEPNLDDALEIMEDHYIKELPKRSTTGQGDGHTSLFSPDSKEVKEPIYIFQINKDYTYLVSSDITQSQKDLGFKLQMYRYNSSKMEVNTSKAKAQMRGYGAIRNIIIILKDDKNRQGIYVNPVERQELMKIVSTITKVTDLERALTIITDQINKSKK